MARRNCKAGEGPSPTASIRIFPNRYRNQQKPLRPSPRILAKRKPSGDLEGACCELNPER